MATKNGLLSLYIRDGNGAETSTAFNITLDDGSTFANSLLRANTAAINFDAVMDAMVYDATLMIHVPVTGCKTSPVAGSDITQTATFNFQDSTPYAAPVVVPGISNSVIENGGIQLTNTQIQALVNFLLSSSTTLQFVSRALAVFTALRDALFSFRKLRKAIAKKVKA